MVTNIKEVFDVLTGDECSVSVKLVDFEKNEYYIRTFLRDPITSRERSGADQKLPKFPYNQNTAFYNILDPNCPNSFFLCNDLKNKENYFNCNINWRNFIMHV